MFGVLLTFLSLFLLVYGIVIDAAIVVAFAIFMLFCAALYEPRDKDED